MSQTVRQLFDLFTAWADKALAARTASEYKRYLGRWVDHVGDVQADELKPHHLLSWGSKWHEIQAVQRFMNWAVSEAELLPRNPFKKVKLPRPGRRRRILSRRDLLRMMRRAKRDFRRFLLLMRETLARPQEARQLEWDDIHWEGMPDGLDEQLLAGKAAFVLYEFKGRDRRKVVDVPRVIPISARLGRMLWRLLRSGQQPVGTILRNGQGKPWTKEAVRLRMGRLRVRVGLVPDRRGETVVCYTLRHTGATEAAAAGVRDRVLADLMGHTSTRTTARYQHLQPEHLHDAMRRIELHRKKKRPGSL